MNFKFFLFRKEFIISFVVCIIVGMSIVGYSVWYGVNLNINTNVSADTGPAPTIDHTTIRAGTIPFFTGK